jgi:hypothetical protein
MDHNPRPGPFLSNVTTVQMSDLFGPWSVVRCGAPYRLRPRWRVGLGRPFSVLPPFPLVDVFSVRWSVVFFAAFVCVHPWLFWSSLTSNFYRVVPFVPWTDLFVPSLRSSGRVQGGVGRPAPGAGEARQGRESRPAARNRPGRYSILSPRSSVPPPIPSPRLFSVSLRSLRGQNSWVRCPWSVATLVGQRSLTTRSLGWVNASISEPGPCTIYVPVRWRHCRGAACDSKPSES